MRGKRKTDVKSGNSVILGTDPVIGEHVVPRACPPGKALGKLVIAKNLIIRSHSVIYGGTKIGNDFQTGHGVLIKEGNVIGDNVSVGSHTIIERENRIEDDVGIDSNCFIPESVIIEDRVWIGPCVTILNVLHPPCPRAEDCGKSVHIERNAKTGGNVTIEPRVTLGRNSFIGMGSVVTTAIPDNVLAFGNPARVVKPITQLTCELEYFKVPYEWERR